METAGKDQYLGAPTTGNTLLPTPITAGASIALYSNNKDWELIILQGADWWTALIQSAKLDTLLYHTPLASSEARAHDRMFCTSPGLSPQVPPSLHIHWETTGKN